jgi:hypothetical protein
VNLIVAVISIAIMVLSWAVIRLTRRIRWLEANTPERFKIDMSSIMCGVIRSEMDARAATQADLIKMREATLAAVRDDPDA